MSSGAPQGTSGTRVRRAPSSAYKRSTSRFVQLVDSSAQFRTLLHSANRLLATVLGVRVVRATASGVVLDEQWFRQFAYFARLFDRLEGVPGDVVECGVAWGRTFSMLASLARIGGTRHVWGFDSWQGLPDADEEDIPRGGSLRLGPFEGASPRDVAVMLEHHRFNKQEIDATISLVEGPFAVTLPDYAGDQIALLHLDVVLYRSYETCLTELWPHVAEGGIVALDEYEEGLIHPGATQAVDEFLDDPRTKGTLERDSISGKYFVVKAGK
jgi:hypothetical protein